MENVMIKLKPGVTLVEENGVNGLSVASSVRLAKNEDQADIIEALMAHEQSLEALEKILHTRNCSPTPDTDEALALAEFILDFENYIES